MSNQKHSSSSVLKRTCEKGHFHCKLTHKCIPEKWVCDEEIDCGYSEKYKLTDGSDEDTDSCKTNYCSFLLCMWDIILMVGN